MWVKPKIIYNIHVYVVAISYLDYTVKRMQAEPMEPMDRKSLSLNNLLTLHLSAMQLHRKSENLWKRLSSHIKLN